MTTLTYIVAGVIKRYPLEPTQRHAAIRRQAKRTTITILYQFKRKSTYLLLIAI
jgi:hypothetical protein